MINIVQGDKYIIPIKITQGSIILTPSDVQDVRIQLADRLLSYTKNEITFNAGTNEWEYYLTQEQTLALSEAGAKLQVGVKIDDDISYSTTKVIPINENIIKKEW